MKRGCLLAGGPVARIIVAAAKKWLENDVATACRPPLLAVVLVGADPASIRYVKKKQAACQQVGIQTVLYAWADIEREALIDSIARLNADNRVDGILVQLPLPQKLRPFLSSILRAIDPEKDVDGLTPFQQGKIAAGQVDGLLPCTPKGILTLLKYYRVPLERMHALIVNRSILVGRPLAALLLNENCTVTLGHSQTRNLSLHAVQADLLICATGQAGWLRKDWVKPGATVVDVGIAVDADGKLTGDVAFSEVSETAHWISPVPGGVGPMTVASLIQNICQAYASHLGLAIPNLVCELGMPGPH